MILLKNDKTEFRKITKLNVDVVSPNKHGDDIKCIIESVKWDDYYWLLQLHPKPFAPWWFQPILAVYKVNWEFQELKYSKGTQEDI